jgi:hypothetical protein
MTTSTVPSAYPFDLSDLLPHARTLTETLGDIPSRNRLMKELKVGAPKATALREALQRAEFTTAPAEAPALPEATSDPVPIIEPAEPEPVDDSDLVAEAPEPAALATGDGHPSTNNAPKAEREPRSWPVWVLALPAFVAIWSGWVGLGELTGFGVVHPLPGIWDSLRLNTAITLPIGVETYAAYALAVWLTGSAPAAARRFARWSAIGSLVFGAAGQVAYHLLTAAGVTQAPWQITTAVACLPVAVLGMGAALAHLIHANHD